MMFTTALPITAAWLAIVGDGIPSSNQIVDFTRVL